MRQFSSFCCIDWSGAAAERPRGIAVAVAHGNDAPCLIEPAGGWSRAAVLDWIIAQKAAHADLLIGFDLSPALPFVDAGAYLPGWSQSPGDPRALWALVEAIAADEPYLTASRFIDHPAIAPHFRRHGGREGARFGGGIGRLRSVEHRQRATGQARSSSCFNLVGAAQVGKASLSGMRLLHRLAGHGAAPADGAGCQAATTPGHIAFWPLDPLPASGPVLIEIYTAIATRAGGVAGNRSKIRDTPGLNAALAVLNSPPSTTARIDDHATDALVTAAWMRGAARDPALWQPAAMTSEVAAQEGWTFGVF